MAEATQHELGNLLSSRDAALELQQQQQKGWRFRQLEFMTRNMHSLDSLETRLRALDQLCTSVTAVVGQQCLQQQDQLAQQLDKLTQCQAEADQLEAAGNKLNVAIAHAQQQWAAKQQKLCASDKGIQVGHLCSIGSIV